MGKKGKYTDFRQFCNQEGCYLSIGLNPVGISNNQTRPAVIQIIDNEYRTIIINFSNNVDQHFIYNLFDQLIKIDHTALLWELRLNNVPFIPDAIKFLQGLRIIRINSDQITSLPDSMQDLCCLKELTLSLPRLVSIPEWVFNCTDLEVLDLYGSGIKIIPDKISNLTKIKVLDLCYTKLEKVSHKLLDLNLVIKDEYWEPDEKENNTGIFVFETSSVNPPTDILRGGRVRLEIYFNNTEKIEQKEVRVLMLGLQGAGKTSLTKRFKEFEDNIPHYQSGIAWTEGISFETIRCKNGVLKVWDFGGQEIMFSTHTLFLRDYCIYVIVLNARQGDQPDRFLDYINQYGKNSSVFIVANHMDVADRRGPDINRIRRLFPKLNIIGQRIWRISCEDPSKYPIDSLYSALLEEADKYFSLKRPLSWVGVAKDLSDMKEGGKKTGKPVNYITREAYIRSCKSNKILDPKEQEEVLDWLCDLGIVFTYGIFQELNPLNDIKVLRPEWITDAIYRIINNVGIPKEDNIDRRKCIVTHEKIRNALEYGKGENGTPNSYSDTEIIFILDIMHQFGLSLKWGTFEEFLPVIAVDEEFVEVASWNNEKRNSIVLDAIFHLVDTSGNRKQIFGVGSKHLYGIIISLIKAYDLGAPEMWRSGALWSKLHGYSILLYLQNENMHQNELRLLILNNAQTNSQLPSTIYSKVESSLNYFSDGYGVEAKVLVKSGGKEDYISVTKAVKSILMNNESGYNEYLDEELSYPDIVETIYGDKVLKEILDLKDQVVKGTSTIDESLSHIKNISSDVQSIKEMVLRICNQVEETSETLNELSDNQRESFVELLCADKDLRQEIQVLRNIDDNISMHAEELANELNSLKPEKNKLIFHKVLSVLSSLSGIVTLTTADYSRITSFIALLNKIIQSIK